MTVEMCLSICRRKGFGYSGLQARVECFCGDDIEKRLNYARRDKCSDKCAGNSNQICGGSYAMSLYSIGIIDGLCIYDFPPPRHVLSGLSVTGHKNMTIHNCKNICKDFEY